MATSFLKKVIWTFLFISLCSAASSTFAAPIRTVIATVTKVSDGDTIQAITPEGTKLKIRLYGIDAPETERRNKKTGHISKAGEPFGKESINCLSSMISMKHVRIDVIAIDRYRRMVGMIWLDNRNINMEMIRAGMAEAYIEYLQEPYRREFIQAEHEAKADKRGIWSQSGSYERPSDFRKRTRGIQN